MSAIDGFTNIVVATFSAGNWPSGVDVNPASNRVYVGNEDNVLLTFDGDTNARIRVLDDGDDLWRVRRRLHAHRGRARRSPEERARNADADDTEHRSSIHIVLSCGSQPSVTANACTPGSRNSI